MACGYVMSSWHHLIASCRRVDGFEPKYPELVLKFHLEEDRVMEKKNNSGYNDSNCGCSRQSFVSVDNSEGSPGSVLSDSRAEQVVTRGSSDRVSSM